jgi:hypothetical protein
MSNRLRPKPAHANNGIDEDLPEENN